jgi:hypothetical protein
MDNLENIYMWSLIKTVLISCIIILSLHFVFHYIKDLLAPKKRKDVISYEINKYKDIVENLITQKDKKPTISKEDELLEEALESLKIWEDNDDTVSVVDFQSMEQDLTEYALTQI